MIGVILAAGKSTRFNHHKSKVLYKVNGKEMIHHVADSMLPFVEKLLIVVNNDSEEIQKIFSNPKVEFITDPNPQGTATSLLLTEKISSNYSNLIVSFADKPLVTSNIFKEIIDKQKETNADTVLATSITDIFTKKGRIIRNSSKFIDIREFKDASEQELKIKEVNTGFSIFKTQDLFNLLRKLNNNNVAKEYYLPHVYKLYVLNNKKVETISIDIKQGLDINTLQDLELI